MLRIGLLTLQGTLGALCCYLLYSVGAALLGAAPLPEPRLPPAGPMSEQGRSLGEYAVIAQRDLFQTLRAAPEPEPEEEVAESTLRVRLIGTAVANPPSQSVASVEDEIRRERFAVRIGDRISGAEVVRIERHRIVLQNRGQLEEIAFPEEPAPPPPPVAARPGPQARAPAAARAGRGTLSRRLQRLADTTNQGQGTATRSRGGLLNQARMLPAYDQNGGFEGLRINFIQEGSEVAEMGLQIGDVIQSVDGSELATPADGLRALRESQPGDAIELLILRGGQQLTIEHVLAEE